MQLFRRQALEHQHRLYGEVLLVPPLRWQAIGWLLFGLVGAAALFVFFGSYSLTTGTVSGRIVPQSSNWAVELKVPTTAIGGIEPGQQVRITLAAYPVQDYGVLQGVIGHIGSAPVEGAEPYFLVTARLDPLTERQRTRGVVLRPDLALTARIVLARRSFLQWLIDPVAAVTRR